MARKNTIKKFVPGGFYHIYNRGINRDEIFLDDADYQTFLYNLKRYLEPGFEENSPKIRPSVLSRRRGMNLAGQVDLLAYCLMPNHFHLLVRQHREHGITQLLRRVCTNYSMYFNKKYDRQGPVFSSIYKAVLIDDQDQLLHVSRYIHLNPVNIKIKKIGPVKTVSAANPADYPYSSFIYYQNDNKPPWINTALILEIISRNNAKKYQAYNQFVTDFNIDSERIYPESLIDVELTNGG